MATKGWVKGDGLTMKDVEQCEECFVLCVFVCSYVDSDFYCPIYGGAVVRKRYTHMINICICALFLVQAMHGAGRD